jgi:hypothetical protein
LVIGGLEQYEKEERDGNGNEKEKHEEERLLRFS